MNPTMQTDVHRRRTLVASTVAFILVVAYTAEPIRPEGGAVQPEAYKDLTAHKALTAHRVCPGGGKVAAALADARFTENHRLVTPTQGESARLGACTGEADTDWAQMATARAKGAERKSVPNQVGGAADAAHLTDANSDRQAAELQRQLELLHAKPAEHGSVFTLGDVLFASGRTALKSDAMGDLNRLVSFLDKYSDRKVTIHGYADNLGSEEDNQSLSERRANLVKAYLAAQGIDSTRLSASGMGQSDPVASNVSAAGRQQNRRVEVIISNPPAALPKRTPKAKIAVLLMLLESISGKGRPLL